MKRLASCMIGAIASSACHSSTQTSMTSAHTSQNVAQSALAAGGPILDQGEYQYDSHTLEMKVPGKPADYGAKQIARERSGAGVTQVRHCVSREEALDPRLIFSLGDKACRFPKFAMTGGKIDLQAICQQGPMTETKIVTGTYTRSSFSVDVSMSISGGPQSGAEDKQQVDAKRIGNCSGNPG